MSNLRGKKIDLRAEDVQYLMNEASKGCEKLVSEENLNDERLDRLVNNEMMTWIKDIFQHIIPNTSLIDKNDNLQFMNEPLDIVEPVDDSLYKELCETESEVEKYIEKLVEDRRRIPEELGKLIHEATVLQNIPLDNTQNEEMALPHHSEEDIDVGELVSTFKTIVDTLSKVDKSLPLQHEKYKTIQSIVKDMD
ncbi:hypothetical protein BDB01DRAFT_845739 [Pilobolus umbonatus]|nr:hypothetical protein BDB01DRAFT_845739 [Pilobolus umbonatus]